MERKKSLTGKVAVTIIILFHIVGLIGFFIPMVSPLFVKLVPYHLLLMLVIMLYSYGRISVRLAGFLLLIWVTGFCCEYIGVHQGWLFGNYKYGYTLGPKVAGVPLVIGVNWFLLVFSAGALMQRTKLRKQVTRIVAGAAVLTLLDVLIEPTAVKFNYWYWANAVVPLKNYVCWFLLSIIMLWVFELFRFRRLNYAGPVLLLMQFIFFLALHWL